MGARNTHYGQSLLEIVVAIGVMGLLITGLIIGTTAALRTSQYGQHRSLAIKYAQEGIEVTRTLRNSTPWDNFVSYDQGVTPAGTIWCLDKANTWIRQDSCSVNIIDNGTGYTRSVLFYWNNTDADPANYRMEVTVTVQWNEGGQAKTVTLPTFFTQWR